MKKKIIDAPPSSKLKREAGRIDVCYNAKGTFEDKRVSESGLMHIGNQSACKAAWLTIENGNVYSNEMARLKRFLCHGMLTRCGRGESLSYI